VFLITTCMLALSGAAAAFSILAERTFEGPGSWAVATEHTLRKRHSKVSREPISYIDIRILLIECVGSAS